MNTTGFSFASGASPQNAPAAASDSSTYINEIKEETEAITRVLKTQGRTKIPREQYEEITESVQKIIYAALQQEKRLSFLEGQLAEQRASLSDRKKEEIEALKAIENTQRDYSRALAKGLAPRDNNKDKPKEYTIIVDGKDHIPDDGWREVMSRKGKSLGLPKPKDIIVTNNNKVIIKTTNREDAATIQSSLAGDLDLGKKIDVSLAKSKRTRILVFGVPERVTPNEVMEELKTAPNQEDSDNKFIKEIPGRRGRNMIFELNHKEATTLIDQRKILLQYQVLHIAECHRVIRCFKCQKYGHFAHKCGRSQVCPICSGPHAAQECTSETQSCNNCKLSNSDNHNHRADCNTCPIFLAFRKELQRGSPRTNNA